MNVELGVEAEEDAISISKGAIEDATIRASIEYFASFQEVDVVCHYCMSRFDHITHLPITLHCGHSICEPCLPEVLQKRRCPQCINGGKEHGPPNPDPEKTYPYNILLLEVLKYEATSLSNQQIKFENLCSSVCNRFLKKFNDIVNSLNSWNEHLKIGEGYLTTLQFYEQELDSAKEMMQSGDETFFLCGKKIAAQACAEIERLAKRFSYEWSQIVGCHKAQSIKGYKLFLFPYYLPTFMTILANNPKTCYAVKRIKGKELYYQITGGENRFHLHCQCQPPSPESRPFYFQISDLMDIINQKTITAFFTMEVTSPEFEMSRYHKVYVELRTDNLNFGASTLSLFLGDFDGISYKDFGVVILADRISIYCNTPYYQSLDVPDEIDQKPLTLAECTAKKVVSDWNGSVGAMSILTDGVKANTSEYDANGRRREPPDIYYGDVIIGYDFIRNLTKLDYVNILECGLSAVTL